MLTSTKTMTPPARSSAPFFDSVLRPKRRKTFSILRPDQTSNAAFYAAIALVVLVGIAINTVLIVRTLISIFG
ncbi:hypothetical protein [Pseudochelatococcus sp. G4_1912]|uniref:hypothetical protein n=1 Tax=Pseudochelatococcus sp. G4_1912 TaxID=3114288 RepID=UPI0039C65EBD